ncbi:hypothetical protein ATCC90586_011528 [Pythium insidiosum]|nr:hypothetical protein ATCC90586_011528 [Pythium insidiosum]
MALLEANQEAVWLKAFMQELGEVTGDHALTVYEDNQGAIALAKNPEFHKRTKHIDIQMLADLMTKPIPAAQFDAHRTKLGIDDAVESRGSVEDDAPRTQRNHSK